MKRHTIPLILIGLLILAGVGTALAQNPNPGVIPNNGNMYAELSARWWLWAFSFPKADVPYLNPGGPVNIGAGQSGHVWFLAGQAPGTAVERTGTVPVGVSLFFPLANFINDYPCPDPTFQPLPGETMEQFLQRTGNETLDYYLGDASDLFATIDGVALTDLRVYRATSSLFMFTADPQLVVYDACITGTPQPGVAVGYWLLLPPLPPGKHTLHFGTPSLGQDITYSLTVTPRHR